MNFAAQSISCRVLSSTTQERNSLPAGLCDGQNAVMFSALTATRIILRIGLVTALAIGGNLGALAMPPGYLTRTWQVEQGLPQNKVTSVVQTRDGYLWCGTYAGLARFDGVRFTVFNNYNTPGLRSSRITSLFEGVDGTLWIGTEGGDISHYQNGRFTTVSPSAKWRGGKIYEIAADEVGDVWLMNNAGELARVRDGRVLTPQPGYIANVVALARGPNGEIWVNREGRVSLLKQGQLQPIEFGATSATTYPFVQGIAACGAGGLWVVCDGRIRKWKDDAWVADLGAAPWGMRIVQRLMESESATLVGGGSDYGVYLIASGQTNRVLRHFDSTDGLTSDWVISLFEDREKNLWCGTGGGLTLIRPSNIEVVSPPHKSKISPVLSVLPTADGTIWVGTEGQGLYRLRNGSWTNFYPNQGIANAFVWSLAADSAGQIWAGTWGGGLYAQKDDAFVLVTAPGTNSFTVPIPALLFVGDELWAGTPAGALRYYNGNLERFSDIAGQPFGDVRAIAKDKSGTMWFGTAGSGLVCLREGRFRRFNKPEGLSSEFIECLHVADDGALWVGTFGGGLNRLKDGKFSAITEAEGLPNGVIGHIESDDHGCFWMSSYGGILRAKEQDLNRCADGEISTVPFVTFGINDGLPTLECSEGLQSAGAKTADGRLWFAMTKGLVAVNPADIRQNPLSPPVRIEAMVVDGKRIPIADGGQKNPSAAKSISNFRQASPSLEIPPGRHRIEFEYTALSFVAPEKVRFKYRLNHFETDWAAADTKRLAVYNYIPPGSYSFEVIACNNDGVWNETGANLTFEVLPHFWQTIWFRVAGGLMTVVAVAGLVWIDGRRRLRRRLEKLKREQALERERARIAQDIHDDLGASLTRIAMLTESARAYSSVPEPVAKNLSRIFGTARELTRALDEIVWAVNPRHDTLDSLANYLNRFAHDYLSAADIPCRLNMPVQLPARPVAAETRHNLFLAFKEALHNVVQHAAATEVHVALLLEADQLVVRVTDNGAGFTATEKSNRRTTNGRIARGNGVANMHRRLASIGGTCEIAGEPGRGTAVTFTVALGSSH